MSRKLTKARSLFRDKKRSDYLTFLKAAICLGSRRGCSGPWQGSRYALFETP